MRSWIKEPEILENQQELSLTSLFKSMIYDYEYANLDSIERATATYILVNWREMRLTANVMKDIEEMVNIFIEKHSTQIANDLINAIANPEIIQERIEYLSRLDN